MKKLISSYKKINILVKLKESPPTNSVSSCASKSYAAFTSNRPNNTKVLMVKQKGQEKDVKQIKKDLQNKVNPGELGIGLSMRRTTRDGGLILSCGNEKEISTVQAQIQSKLGENYEVDRPKTHDHKIKAGGG